MQKVLVFCLAFCLAGPSLYYTTKFFKGEAEKEARFEQIFGFGPRVLISGKNNFGMVHREIRDQTIVNLYYFDAICKDDVEQVCQLFEEGLELAKHFRLIKSRETKESLFTK